MGRSVLLRWQRAHVLSARLHRRGILAGALIVAAGLLFAGLVPPVGAKLVTAAGPNLIANPSFESSVTGWTSWQGALQRVADPQAATGSYDAVVLQTTGTAYSIDNWPGLAAGAPGTTYTVTADASAASWTSIGKPVSLVAREHTVGGTVVQLQTSATVSLTRSWQQVSVILTVAKAGDQVDVYLVQNTAVSGDAFYADAFSMTAPVVPTPTPTPPPTPTPTHVPTPTATPTPPTNLLQNGSFDASTLSPWYLALQGGGAGTVAQDATTDVSGPYSAKLAVTTPNSAAPWDVQLNQSNLALAPNTQYVLTFAAKASSARTLTTGLQQNGSPYTLYADQTITLTTAWQQYSVPLPVGTVADSNAALRINVAGATGTVWLDNVALASVATPTPAPTAPPTPTPSATATAAPTPTPTPTGMAAPVGYSHDIFDDQFTGTTLNTSNWDPYLTSGSANCWPWNYTAGNGSGMGTTNDEEYFEPSQVTVNNGLQLAAVRGSNQPGYTWTSGTVTTCGHFAFNGGYLQVKAKLPPGSGMWPGIWMLPAPGVATTDNFEIDALEGGALNGSSNPNNNVAWHEHEGSLQAGGVTTVSSDLTQGYHVYGLNWVPGQSITWYVDGVQVGQLTSATFTIPNEPMEILLTLAVGNASTAGWRTADNGTAASPSTMNVAEVQVWQ